MEANRTEASSGTAGPAGETPDCDHLLASGSFGRRAPDVVPRRSLTAKSSGCRVVWDLQATPVTSPGRSHSAGAPVDRWTALAARPGQSSATNRWIYWPGCERGF